MGITVRRASTGNWIVMHSIIGAASLHRFLLCLDDTYEHIIRTYTCTNWTDAMRIADDLANERTIDPNRIIALSERRV
jgi:hypothetical protein